MRKIIFISLLAILITACPQKREFFDNYTASIKDFQYKLNTEFSDKKESPLTEEGFKKFTSLDFFPVDSMFKITAVFELEGDQETFEMPTTTERLPIYKTYGKALFTIDGKELILHIYQNQDLIKKKGFENHLFIPFMDITNGNETYEGGRFIDLKISESNTIVIDFNTAYNPYCAYNHKYSCPIPPKENNLEVAIKAGVKAYKK